MPRDLTPGAEPPQLLAHAREFWPRHIIPAVEEHIRVPALSPAFDQDWDAHGFLDRVAQDAVRWTLAHAPALPGLRVELVRLPGRTPLVFFELPGDAAPDSEAVLFYGHLDKQPAFSGWRTGLGPWTPVRDQDRLYGRGGADDGYAIHAAIGALLALKAQHASLPRCVGVFETCEESGSYDLPACIEALADRIRAVGLVVCLDSGAGSFDQLWTVTSLRGYIGGTLEVQVLDEGAHSGDAGGIVPSSLRILRHLLDRLEDSATGRLLAPSLHVEVPPDRLRQTREAAKVLGDRAWKRFGWHVEDGQTVLPVTTDPEQALLARAWRSSLAITGASGLPALADAGNVLRPRTAFKLSLRLPPTTDSAIALADVRTLLEFDPPYSARVRFKADKVRADGWNAPPFAPWLEHALDAASTACFGAPCAHIGQGGTIPLMGILAKSFPTAQFMVCGVLGPGANAHGPNEFLHIPYATGLTACVAATVSAFASAQVDAAEREQVGAESAAASS
jgi:acetylornithine deacetylase/succinyl-diaminopimelate desuccinylase-like protein